MTPPDVFDKFKEMRHTFSGNNPNPNENIQRIDITSMDKHFNKLKNSEVTFDTTFYNELVKAIDQKDFAVMGFLTWSLNHQFKQPATVEMFSGSRSYISVPPMKI